MRIGISGFQSFEKATLDFEGFAVITGESNLGKSAVVRAIGALLFGLPGEFFLRRGRSAAAVGIRFDDSLTLKWQKVPASKKSPGKETTLEINGVPHTKLGRDHFSLLEPWGFVKVQTQAGDIKPQIAGQFDKAFLLDVSETVVAEVFKVLGRGDVIALARDNAKRALGKVRNELKIREVDYATTQGVVDSKKWVRPFRKSVSDLGVGLARIEPIQRMYDSVSELHANEIPSNIPEVPKDPQLDPLIGLLESISRYREITIPEVPSYTEPKELGLLEGVVKLIADMSTCEDSLSKIETELAEVSDSLKLMEKELGVCPTCGNMFEECRD
jgi:hypothetical protein